jgi:tripartite-type tricarboxylate transporter receptor subunit TctC
LRARPGEINYSTAGSGTVGHLAAELLSSMTKIKLVHVPHKGSGPSMVDLVAGHVQMQLSSMPAAIRTCARGTAAHDRADGQPFCRRLTR